MSTANYMTREQLAEIIKSKPDTIAIVDVRDDDYIGGHIKGALNVPSSTLDYRIPELARTLKGKEKVVFHCALSQQRGPKAARRFLGQLEGLRQNEASASSESSKEQDATAATPAKAQEVYILQGGFTQWQDVYGLDETLTEDYAADLWRF
ncbi:MAG: hypothetical protein MMC23_006214 [Stictis urceolatum]|nr:hypothetical protein [Stictis urceolata]